MNTFSKIVSILICGMLATCMLAVTGCGGSSDSASSATEDAECIDDVVLK